MIKEIKGSNKISETPALLNDNFKELDERLRKIEEKLRIRRKIKK